MSVMIIDDEVKARIKEILDYAETHPYRRGGPVPGDIPEHVTRVGSYRCVFSYTHVNAKIIWRHLSISTTRKSKFPHPFTAFTIAELFGFTGWDGKKDDGLPNGWLCDANERENCIVLVQPINPNERKQ